MTTKEFEFEKAPSGFTEALECDECGRIDSWIIAPAENPYSNGFYIECECGRNFGVVEG